MENIKDFEGKNRKINIEKALSNPEFDAISFLVDFLEKVIEFRNSFIDPRTLKFDINQLELDEFDKIIFDTGDSINKDFDEGIYQLIEMILLKEKIKVRTIEKTIKKYIDLQQYHKLKAMMSTLKYDKVPLDINKIENSNIKEISSSKIKAKKGAFDLGGELEKIKKSSSKSISKIDIAIVSISILIFLAIVILRIKGISFKYTIQTFIILFAINIYFFIKARKNEVKELKNSIFILISKDYKSKFYLEQGNNFFGRSADYSDHVVDEKTIGRRHANIIVSGQSIFVRDLNSMNGTFINDREVKNIEMAVYENDIIKLANKEFILLRN
jgi:hypothetical protein